MKKRVRKLSNLIYFVLSFFVLCAINLSFSDLIYERMALGLKFSCPIFKLTYAQNTGAAFSIMQDSTMFLSILSAVSLLVIFIYVLKFLSKSSKKTLLLLAILASGIFGNMLQRFSLGYVRDFFELTFCNFPIFNISDIFITIGVIGISILVLFSRK